MNSGVRAKIKLGMPSINFQIGIVSANLKYRFNKVLIMTIATILKNVQTTFIFIIPYYAAN